MWPSNPAIHLQTRRFLWTLAAEPRVLDEPCLRLIQRGLEKSLRINPCGLVFALADALGAERQVALDVASFAELFYATCSLTDDVQDGDGAALFPDAPVALGINVAAQMLCVTVARGAALAEALGPGAALDELAAAFRVGTAMLCGQRVELLREDWSPAAWLRVAELSAGRQFELYLRLAAGAARAEPAPLIACGTPLGVLAQLEQDRLSNDSRVSSLPASDLETIARGAADRLRSAAANASASMPPRAARLLDSVVARACAPFETAVREGTHGPRPLGGR